MILSFCLLIQEFLLFLSHGYLIFAFINLAMGYFFIVVHEHKKSISKIKIYLENLMICLQNSLMTIYNSKLLTNFSKFKINISQQCLHINPQFCQGVVHKLRWQDFFLTTYHLPFVDIFYGINVDKKWTFFDHLPTSSCKRSLGTPPNFFVTW